MNGTEKRIASRALRYMVIEKMERDDAIILAMVDYAELTESVDLETIVSCLDATTKEPRTEVPSGEAGPMKPESYTAPPGARPNGA